MRRTGLIVSSFALLASVVIGIALGSLAGGLSSTDDLVKWSPPPVGSPAVTVGDGTAVGVVPTPISPEQSEATPGSEPATPGARTSRDISGDAGSAFIFR